MTYDSTPDTLAHIATVQARLQTIIHELNIQAAHHDESKLWEPEKSGFDRLTMALKNVAYGTEAYRAALAEALDSAQIPEGLRKVELHVHLNATGDAIEFQVIDNGLGLAPEVEQHLFEAFYSTKQEGMGIGLNLCRSIIEAHGGELRARNLYNEAGNSIQGCCFHFTLPLQPSLQSDGSNESAPS